MNKIKKLVCVLTAFTLLAPGAGAVVLDSAVVTVNGSAILNSDFQKVADGFIIQQEAAAPGSTQNPEIKKLIEVEVLNRMVDDKLLFQASEKEKIKVYDEELKAAVKQSQEQLIPKVDPATGKERNDKEIKKQFDAALKKEGLSTKQFEAKMKEQLAVRKLIETVIVPKIKPVEEAEVKKMYDEVNAFLKQDAKAIAKIPEGQHKQEVAAIAARLHMLSSAQVRIGHIYIQVPADASKEEAKARQDKARQIRKEITNGSIDFNSAVQKYTDDKQGLATTGGDMVFVKGQEPKAIVDKAFTLDVGALSEPIKTDLGWHIIKVKERKAAEDVTYDKVAQEFARFIAQQKVQLAIAEYVNTLRAAATIKIDENFEKAHQPAPKAEAPKADAKAEAKK